MATIPLGDYAIQKLKTHFDVVDGCWLWKGHVRPDGYAMISVKGTCYYVHRAAFQYWRGPIDPGMTIDHMCHNRSCVNPDHLQQVTQALNSQNKAGAMKNSQSGVRGVFPGKRGVGWRAVVNVGGRPRQLGTFPTVAEAERAAIAGRMKYFTNNLLDRATV